MNLLFPLLIALPFCAAQFRIQGPSDGNRAAESLSVDDGKVEFSGHKAPSSGGFTIQGASDGHSNVQGASDGHSDFQLRAATALGADRYVHPAPSYNIQGASDGRSQIQGSYDGSSSPKSLEYNDPSGLRVNWRSYDRNVRPSPQQEPQYAEVQASVQRAPQRQRARPRPQQPAQVQPQPQRQSYEPVLPPVQPYENAPAEIKQLLHFQKLLPYMNIIPEPFRYENIISAHANQPQQPQYQPEEQPRYVPEPRRPPSRGKARGPPRQKRQAQKQAQRHQQAEQQLQYSTHLPPEIRQILKFQQQTPYINGIPEQFRFNAEAAQKEQLEAVRAHFREIASSPPQHHSPRSRQKRQAGYSHQQQQQQQPQRPPPEPQLQYSTNLPGYVKELLNYQAQIPYTILPNLIGVTRPEKPYVPQPVQRPDPAPVPAPLPAAQPQYHSQANAYQGQANAYQPQANAQPNVAYQGQQSPYQNQIGSYQNQAAGAYQDQGNAYQGQPNVYKNQADAYQAQQSAYNQVYQSEVKYPQYQQGQPNQGGIRPVTENQY
ncbi:uncharacterized protein LOC144467721 [Augochlora pura]